MQLVAPAVDIVHVPVPCVVEFIWHWQPAGQRYRLSDGDLEERGQ
jgi:hypothetical protein